MVLKKAALVAERPVWRGYEGVGDIEQERGKAVELTAATTIPWFDRVEAPNEMILPHQIRGKLDGETLFFLHGWPDDGRLWDTTVEVVGRDYRCVTVTLPHFGGREEAKRMGYDPWGYDFDDMADIIAETIYATCTQKTPLTMVMFDWGAIYGFTLLKRHPTLVRRVVCIDIGPQTSMTYSTKELLRFISVGILYQYRIIFCFLLARMSTRLQGIADWLNQRHMRNICTASSLSHDDKTADCGYPYWYYHSNFVTGYLTRRPSQPKVCNLHTYITSSKNYFPFCSVTELSLSFSPSLSLTLSFQLGLRHCRCPTQIPQSSRSSSSTAAKSPFSSFLGNGKLPSQAVTTAPSL